ncbi:MAG: hypothetical protein MMC23_007624 [Stictis urceolatum]|nr:hypothetical protein [Stictis urceolata]
MAATTRTLAEQRADEWLTKQDAEAVALGWRTQAEVDESRSAVARLRDESNGWSSTRQYVPFDPDTDDEIMLKDGPLTPPMSPKLCPDLSMIAWRMAVEPIQARDSALYSELAYDRHIVWKMDMEVFHDCLEDWKAYIHALEAGEISPGKDDKLRYLKHALLLVDLIDDRFAQQLCKSLTKNDGPVPVAESLILSPGTTDIGDGSQRVKYGITENEIVAEKPSSRKRRREEDTESAGTMRKKVRMEDSPAGHKSAMSGALDSGTELDEDYRCFKRRKVSRRNLRGEMPRYESEDDEARNRVSEIKSGRRRNKRLESQRRLKRNATSTKENIGSRTRYALQAYINPKESCVKDKSTRQNQRKISTDRRSIRARHGMYDKQNT